MHARSLWGILLASLAAGTGCDATGRLEGADGGTTRDGSRRGDASVPVGCEGPGCEGRSFCDPATWVPATCGVALPTAASDVVVVDGQAVVVDCEIEVRSLEVQQGATLQASRERSSRLTLHGNLVVRGLLDYGTPDSRVPAGTTA